MLIRWNKEGEKIEKKKKNWTGQVTEKKKSWDKNYPKSLT